MTSTDTDTTEVTGISADLFDCVQVNLAVLARRWHGPGAELVLGADLGFRPRPGPGGLPTVEPDPAAEIERCAGAAGLVVRFRATVDPAAATPVPGSLVVADAFALPWLPYAGRRHLDHGFLVDDAGPDVLGGIDAYHADTPWGPVRPSRWRMTRAAFAALPGPVLVATLAPGPPPEPDRETAAHRADRAGGVDGYVAAFAGHADRRAAWERLTLETWLLSRARHLHGAYRDATGGADPARDAHLADWRSLVEQVYLASRRVERGRPEPPGALDRLAALLHRDRDVFGAGDGLRAAVAGVVADVLGTDPAALLPDRPLAEVAAVDSFRLVQIVERVEDALGAEFDPDLLLPENLTDVDAITRALLRSSSRPAG